MFLTNRPRKLLASLPRMYAAMGASALADDEALAQAQAKQLPIRGLRKLPTSRRAGLGGATGNAGGVAVAGRLAAVVNFNSTSVTILVRRGNAMEPTQVIKTASQPVSSPSGTIIFWSLD